MMQRLLTSSLTRPVVVVSALAVAAAIAASAANDVHGRPGPPTARVEVVKPLPLPVAVQGTARIAGQVRAVQAGDWAVDVKNFPATPVRTPVHDGKFFDVTQPAAPPFLDAVTLSVPAGVVLTDAHATFSVPENIANAASLFIMEGSGEFLVYQIVSSTTFHAGVDLASGIVSDGNLTVGLSCYNIAGNHCQGALMWSGYTTP
jgi:hypothetical protein